MVDLEDVVVGLVDYHLQIQWVLAGGQMAVGFDNVVDGGVDFRSQDVTEQPFRGSDPVPVDVLGTVESFVGEDSPLSLDVREALNDRF